MTPTTNHQEFTEISLAAVSNPWTYIGVESGIASLLTEQAGKVFNDAIQFANDAKAGLLSDAQRYQTASDLWSDLSSGLRNDLVGLRARLNATQQVWAGKVIDSLQATNVIDDIVETASPRFAKTTIEIGRQLGGVVAAAQLLYELNKTDESGVGPTVNDVGKAALGVGVGLLVTALGGVSLPAIGVGVLAGWFTDIAWDMYSGAILSDEYKKTSFWDNFYDNNAWARSLAGALNDVYQTARTFLERRDPLALDLDGDGLETTGIDGSHPTQFDHDGDGLRTGTGWLQGDDAFLALDRNNNGKIDNGSELFGVDTVLATGPNAGQTAANGFAALADLDSNHDGLFNALDSQYDSVRLWRDLNQDGLSQADELTTLKDSGITSINLASTATNIALPGGNVQSAAGTYTRSNGQTGRVGEFTTGTSGNLDLAQNPLYSTFTDPIPLTAAAQTLPGLHGSGRVRDLREAAHLETPLGVLERFNGLPFVTVDDNDVTTGQGSVINASALNTLCSIDKVKAFTDCSRTRVASNYSEWRAVA